MKTFNLNNHVFLDNEQGELKKSTNSENNDDFKKRFTKEFNNQMNNFQNTDLIGLKYFPERKGQNSLENAPNERSQKYINDNKKDISYYNQLINSLNKELGIVSDKSNIKNNFSIPRNNNNINYKKYNNNDNKRKNKNHNFNKKEIIKENNINKLTDLENNKIFLLNKNKEIEEQINNLQNLAQKVNLINEKNNHYINNNLNVNMNNNIYKEDDKQYNNDFNINLLMNDQTNYIINNNNSYKIPENYSNILQDKNNYIQIEDDSIEPLFEEKKNNFYNFEFYNERIHNYTNFNNQVKKNNDNLEQLQPCYENYENNISSSSRNNKQNLLKKNKTFNQRKTHDIIRPKNIKLKSKKRKDSNCISSTGSVVTNEDSKKIIKRLNSYKNRISSSSKEKKNKNKKKLKKSINNKIMNEFKNDDEDMEYKFNYLKNIIGEIDYDKFDDRAKLFLIDKINELQIDFINKISSLEKKYKIQNDNNKIKIKKLEKENSDLRKKVIKIKSIV